MAGSKGKKQKTGSSSTNPASLRSDGHNHVRFATVAQFERFEVLKGMTFNPTRFICSTLLNRLGLLHIFAGICIGTGMPSLANMAEYTYYSLTLEFLSSFYYNGNEGTCQFRLFNHNFDKSASQMAEYMGFNCSDESLDNPPSNFNVSTAWTCLTGDPSPNMSNLGISQIQHPAMKLFFRLMGGTVFGRKEPGKSNKTEASIVGSFLNVKRQQRFTLNVTKFMMAHLHNVGKGGLKTIEVGGLVTRIARGAIENFNEEELTPMTDEVPLLDWDHFTGKNRWIAGDLDGTDPVRWYVASKEWVNLPCNQLPTIEPLPYCATEGPLPCYLIRPWLIYYEGARGRPQTLQPPPDGGEGQHEDMAAGSGGFETQFGNVPEVGQSSSYGAPQMGQFVNVGAPDMGQSSNYVAPDYANAGQYYTSPPPYYANMTQEHRDRQNLHFQTDARLHYSSQYHIGVNSGAIPRTPPFPTYYYGPQGQPGYFPEHIIRQSGYDPATYNQDFHLTYGGFGGQYLGYPRPPPPGGDDTMDDQ